MPTKGTRCRVLAIEARTYKIGYAVFEGRETIIDWGIRWFTRGDEPDLSRKLKSLLQMSRPSVILISNIDTHKSGPFSFPVADIKKYAALHSIPAKLLSKKCLRLHFRRNGHWNKHEVAQALAHRFPELAWNFPRKRRA